MPTRYIAFLRGINVGGHAIKMETLKGLLVELGYRNVRSYISSGNIFFEANETDRTVLTATIEQHLHEVLGYAVPTFLRTIAEVEAIVAQAPFQHIRVTDDTRFCVMFTKQPLDRALTLPQQSSKQDIDLIGVTTHEAFVVWHIINNRPPSGSFASAVIPAENTTRFYHTTAKILAAAQSFE